MHRIIGAFMALTLLAAPAAANDGKQAAALALEAAQGLQRLFEQASFASLPTTSDLPWLTDWCGAVGNANYAILAFGADPKRIAELPEEEVARSLLDYEDQLVTAAVFIHKMVPRLMTTALDTINGLPGTKHRSRVPPDGPGTSNSFREIVEGPLAALATGSVKAQTISALLAALRDNAETSAKLTPPDQRGRLAKLVATMRDKAPGAQPADRQRAALTTLEQK
jgi:hypothetical protein